MNIEHFALNVADPIAAAAWYVQHLGLRDPCGVALQLVKRAVPLTGAGLS